MTKIKLSTHILGCVNCLNFSSNGDLFCSGSDDLRINIWDWRRNKLLHQYHSCTSFIQSSLFIVIILFIIYISGHSNNVFQCRWCLDNNHIVTCARDGQVRICDINDTSSTKLIAQHKSQAHRVNNFFCQRMMHQIIKF